MGDKKSINGKEGVVGTAIGLLLVLVLILGLRFLVGGDEDTWLCKGGEWVKHGSPSGPPPETGCGEPVMQEAEERGFVDPSEVSTEELTLDRARLVRNKEGMKPDTWYVQFDLESGYTWFEVLFAAGAQCAYDGQPAECESLYPPAGSSTSFAGARTENDEFLVTSLQVTSP